MFKKNVLVNIFFVCTQMRIVSRRNLADDADRNFWRKKSPCPVCLSGRKSASAGESLVPNYFFHKAGDLVNAH